MGASLYIFPTISRHLEPKYGFALIEPFMEGAESIAEKAVIRTCSVIPVLVFLHRTLANICLPTFVRHAGEVPAVRLPSLIG
jgi:hypothetical protein